MVDRFVEVLDCLDTTFIDAGLLDHLPQPGRLGAVQVGGIDINRPRARAVMQALLALSPNPAGFTSLGPVSAAPWTNATPLSITKCEASSTPLASPLEPHPQLFHDA